MALIQELDYGTPPRIAETLVTLEIDGKPVTVPAGTSVMRAAIEVGHERGRGLVVADVSARIHVAISGAMLQRNSPLPSRAARGAAALTQKSSAALAAE